MAERQSGSSTVTAAETSALARLRNGLTRAADRALNEDLAREYQAIIAYVIYSQVLKGAPVHEHRRGAGDARRARSSSMR